MIEELLLALNGHSCDIFYPPAVWELENDENRSWKVAPELTDFLHPGERELLSKLLILSSYVVDIENFIEKYDSVAFFRQITLSTEKNRPAGGEVGVDADPSPIFGACAASLSEGLSSILEKYRARLTELENIFCDYDNNDFQRPSNTLLRIYSDLQHYFRIFPVLEKILVAVASSSDQRNGGEILSFLCRLYELERADLAVKTELDTLLRRCLVPFRDHLINWLATGRLENDRFEEFFIQGSKDKGETTTDGRFIVRKEYVPSFINEATAAKLLFIGNSVRMMAESSARIAVADWGDHLKPLSTTLRLFSFNESGSSVQYDDLFIELEKNIETIRRAAAEKLYAHCFEGTNAKKVVEAWVKNAFFLGKGELFLAFIDARESTLFGLDQRAKESPMTFSGTIMADQPDPQMQSLLRSWTTAVEKIYWQDDEEREYFDKITPYLSPETKKETTDLGWNAVHLRLELPQRLQPIFTPKFTADLNVVFRFLLRWRRTQSLIESCWLQLKKSPDNVARSLPSLEKIHQLTSLMLFVVKNLQYYIQADVLEIVYSETTKELSSCRDFERVLELLHGDMLDQIYAHCFLKREGAQGDSWQAKIGKILKIFGDECDTFSTLILTRLKPLETVDLDSSISSRSSTSESDRVFAAKVHECYVNFQRKTALLFKVLTTSKVHDNSACLSRLLLRLDFNNYFSSTKLFSTSP